MNHYCVRKYLILKHYKLSFLYWLWFISSCRDLSEQIKKVTKESHVRAENTELMMSFQRGQVSLTQYKVSYCNKAWIFKHLPQGYWDPVAFGLTPFPSSLQLLLCSLHEIYQALEEELDRNSDHPGVAPIYFPTELARLESIEKDLEFFYGQDWKQKIVVPSATKRYSHRLRQVYYRHVLKNTIF